MEAVETTVEMASAADLGAARFGFVTIGTKMRPSGGLFSLLKPHLGGELIRTVSEVIGLGGHGVQLLRQCGFSREGLHPVRDWRLAPIENASAARGVSLGGGGLGGLSLAASLAGSRSDGEGMVDPTGVAS
jgi:hypothetical protein